MYKVEDYKPTNWSKYFNEQKDIVVNNNSFHVYKTGTNGTLLITLHGGGYSALTWSLFAREILLKLDCQILAIDMRGHGSTFTNDDENLSLEQLVNDLSNIIDAMYENCERPSMVLIGHSLGGAVAIEAALRIAGVIGICIIDVVEETALESLSHMQNLLKTRPNKFDSVESAVKWCLKSGQTHNLEAAKVSMPGQIKNNITNKLAATENLSVSSNDIQNSNKCLINDNTITEDVIYNVNSGSITNTQNNINGYSWRIDLTKTENHWNGWFKGLSEKFLNVKVPKILILANINGLDTTLTIGQMQGKFQLQVLPKCGHAIQEDKPDQVADLVSKFLIKQKLAVSKVNLNA